MMKKKYFFQFFESLFFNCEHNTEWKITKKKEIINKQKCKRITGKTPYKIKNNLRWIMWGNYEWKAALICYIIPHIIVCEWHMKNTNRERQENVDGIIALRRSMLTTSAEKINRKHEKKYLLHMMKGKHCWNDLIMKKFNQKVTFSVVNMMKNNNIRENKNVHKTRGGWRGHARWEPHLLCGVMNVISCSRVDWSFDIKNSHSKQPARWGKLQCSLNKSNDEMK